jgi:hypothetical protein
MLPSTATQLARAAGDTAREKFDVVVRRTTNGSGCGRRARSASPSHAAGFRGGP